MIVASGVDLLTRNNTIPSDLKDRAQWLTWFKAKDGNKVPKGRTNDPSTWCVFSAVSALKKIAFVIYADDPYTGVDLDNCIDERGQYREWARPILEKFKGLSYCEYSPSGRGVKLLTIGTKLPNSRCAHVVAKASDGDKAQQIECYDNRRFWTITGSCIGQGFEKIGLGQSAVDWLCSTYLTRSTPQQAPASQQTHYHSDVESQVSRYLSAIPGAVSGQKGHDQTLKVAIALVKGFNLPKNVALRILRDEYNGRCSPPWSERELQHKVDDADRLPDTKERGWKIRSQQPGSVKASPATASPKDAPPPPPTCRAASILTEYLVKLREGRLPRLLKQHSALDGIEVGEGLVTVIGAPPGQGKTALASQVMFDALELDEKIRVVIANAETSFEGLLRREFARTTRIPSDQIRFGDLDDKQLTAITEASVGLLPRLQRVSVLNDPHDLDQLMRLKDEPPGLVVVDYLQKFAPFDKDPRIGVNMVMSGMRSLAKSGWAVLCLSATTRAKDGKHDSKSLSLSSFKESGEIEFNADSCYLLCDQGPENESQDYIRKILLKHVKNRHGAKRDIELIFHMPRMEFSKPDPIGHPEFNDWSSDADNDPFAMEDQF